MFTSKIQEFMPGAVTLSMDMYNDSSMLLEGNFDDPRLTDHGCLLENLKGLKNGETVQAPVYDYKESKRTGYVTVPCPASKVVILEGIYALNEKLRPMMDLRVSVHGRRTLIWSSACCATSTAVGRRRRASFTRLARRCTRCTRRSSNRICAPHISRW